MRRLSIVALSAAIALSATAAPASAEPGGVLDAPVDVIVQAIELLA